MMYNAVEPAQEAGYDDIIETIIRKLGLSDRANVLREYNVSVSGLGYRPDFLIEDNGRRYYVELKSKVDFKAIAQIHLFKDLLEKCNTSEDSVFAIAGKVIPPAVEKVAKIVGIILIELPPRLALFELESRSSGSKIKLTSPKAWKVIAALLREKATSVRQLSVKENVSYGWAHATVQTLINQGIVTRKGNLVYINDANKLLNGIAWERPFENLFAEEINVSFDNAHLAAVNISHVLKKQGIKFAFTGYTSGGLYTGYAIRYDALYLYLNKEDIELVKNEFASRDKDGIKVRIYAPDRDVFSRSRELESTTVTSPDQTLLDLAGLGYGGMELTKVMVEKYAAF